MDSRTLRQFLAVAETGSISAAAGRLHTVQSNVTAHIKRLEAELGLPLFYRKSRGVELTPGGEVLLGYARRVQHLLEEAGKAVQNAGDGVGRLQLGTLETLAAVRLPPVLARFRKRFPQIALHLTTGSTEWLVGEILEHRLDAAYVAGNVKHPGIVYHRLHEEELVLVSEAGRKRVENLSGEILLVFRRGCAFRARAELWLQESGLFPQSRMEFGALDAILGCVSAGMGVSLLPRVVVDRPQYRKLVRAHTIPARYARLSTGMIVHRAAVETRALSELLAMVAA
jgi:DNA-binding transcriptional LysR family regulator